jgi:hypothetical protein
MTTFKIKRLAFMKNPRHDEGIPVLTHDEIVAHIIKEMRRSGHRLIFLSGVHRQANHYEI